MTGKTEISRNVHKNEAYIRKRCENCADIMIRPMRLGDERKTDCLMVYIEVAVSNMMLDDSAIGKMINHFWEVPPEQISQFMKNNSLGVADVKKLADMEAVFDALLAGNAVFFADGYEKAMKISSKGYPNMGVSEAESEKVLRGSREGFCDSVKINSALIRKRIRDTRLKVEEKTAGIRSNTVVQILYVDDLIHEELAEKVSARLDEYTIDGVLDSGMLEQLMDDNWLSPFPQFQTTERPDRAALELLNGKMVILCDNSPDALILPGSFSGFMESSEDWYHHFEMASFLRILRYLALLASVLLPENEVREMLYLLNTANLDCYEYYHPDRSVIQSGPVAFCGWLETKDCRPYRTEVQLYKSLLFLKRSIDRDLIVSAQREALQTLRCIISNLEYRFYKAYGMEIEDKRTVYGECTYRLVPREDEPSVCLMHDWIYLPTA